jgi:hypothetical protein
LSYQYLTISVKLIGKLEASSFEINYTSFIASSLLFLLLFAETISPSDNEILVRFGAVVRCTSVVCIRRYTGMHLDVSLNPGKPLWISIMNLLTIGMDLANG